MACDFQRRNDHMTFFFAETSSGGEDPGGRHGLRHHQDRRHRAQQGGSCGLSRTRFNLCSCLETHTTPSSTVSMVSSTTTNSTALCEAAAAAGGAGWGHAQGAGAAHGTRHTLYEWLWFECGQDASYINIKPFGIHAGLLHPCAGEHGVGHGLLQGPQARCVRVRLSSPFHCTVHIGTAQRR